jgi:hypothetical protein
MENLSGGGRGDEDKLTNHDLLRLGIRRLLVIQVIEIDVNLFVGRDGDVGGEVCCVIVLPASAEELLALLKFKLSGCQVKAWGDRAGRDIVFAAGWYPDWTRRAAYSVPK